MRLLSNLFTAAKPAEPWDGVRDATAEGNICAQIQTFPHESAFIGGEDCLFINVYTPTLEGEFLPVMLWSHAGNFNQGSGNSDLYGPEFLVEKDIIVVTFNYRTGPLGFLSLDTPEVPGNAGLKDQVLALKWVKENIGSFGGNSGNITLFGEGAGGASSSFLTLSPLSKDLVSKAIFQSGTSLNPFALVEEPLDNAKELAKSLGCESNDAEEIFLFLQAVSVRDLIETAHKLDVKFAPVIEKEFPVLEAFLTEHPVDILSSGRSAKIPILIGKTVEEAAVELAKNFSINDDLRNFIPKTFNVEPNSQEGVELSAELKKFYFNDAHIGMDTLHQYLKLLGDKEYGVDIHRYIQILIQNSVEPVYSYRFSYVGGFNILKKVLESFGLEHAGHMDELGYLFSVASLKDAEVSPSDLKTRETMVQLWTNFAKTGNPTPDENQNLTVTWLPATAEHRYYLDIDKELTLATNIDQERMQFWDSLYTKYYKAWNTPGSPAKDVELNKVQEVPVNAVYEYEQPQSQDLSGTNEEIATPNEEITTPNEEITTLNEEIATPNEKKPEIVEEVNVTTSPLINVTSCDDPAESSDSMFVNVDSEATFNNPAVNVVEAEDNVDSKITHEVETHNEKINGDDNIKVTNGVKNENIDDDYVKKETETREEEEVIKKIDKVIIEEEKKEKRFEVKTSNGTSKDIIRANDPPEDDLPKNIGVNKFVNFFESLGGKKN